MTKQKFNLKNLPIRYKSPDMIIISLGDLENLNESRLFFEIALSIGLMLIGAAIPSPNVYLFTSGSAFIIAALFLIWRNRKKYNEIINVIK